MRKHLYILVITVVMAMVLVACSSTETTLPGVDGDVADGDSVDGDVSDVVDDVEGSDITDKTDDVDPVEDGDATDDVDDVDQITDGDDEPDAVDTEGFEDGDIELPPTPCGISGTLRVSDDFVDGDEVNVMLFDEYPFNFSDDFPNGSIALAMYNEWNIGRSVPYSFENLAAGTYWVLVQAEKSPYLAVPAGGPWELTVDGGCNLENLDIYLGVDNAQAGSISGNAVLADSWGDPEQYIIIVNALPTDQWPPNDTDSWPAAIEIIIPVDSSVQGRSFPYSLGNLPEGNYMVFAWLNRLSDDTQMAMAQHPTPLVIDYDLSKDYENIDLLFRGQQTDGDVDVDVDDEPEPLGSLGGDLHISQTIVDDSMRVAVLLFDQQPFGENSPGPVAATELTSFPGLKSAYTFNDLPAGSYWLVGAAAEAGAEDFENPAMIALYPENPVVFVPNDPGFDNLDIYLGTQSPQLGSISGRAWIPAEFNDEGYDLYCLATNEEPDFESMPDVAAFTPVFPLIEEGIYAFGDFTLPNLAARDYWVVCALENSETGAMLSVDWDGPFTVAENGPGAHIDGGEYFLGVGDPSLGSISGVVDTLYAPPQGFMLVVGLYDQEPAQGVEPLDYALTLADGQTTEFPYMLDNLQSDDYWVGAVLLANMNRPAGMVLYENNPIALDISDPDAKDWTDIDMTLYNGALEGTLDVLPPFQSPGSMAWLSMTPPDTDRTLFVEVPLSASSTSLGHLEGPFVLGGFYPAEYTVAVFFDNNGNGALDTAEKTAPVFATPRNYTYPDASQASQDFSASFPQ